MPKMWHTKLSFVPVCRSTRDSPVDLHAVLRTTAVIFVPLHAVEAPRAPR